MKDYSGYPNTITLEIELLSSDEYPGSAYMIFDLDFEKVFGSKGRIPVVFSVDGHRYRSTIAVYDGVHMMVFNKTMRDETGYKAGDKITATIERDQEQRKVSIADDIKAELDRAGVREAFERYSYSHQKEDIAWIEEAKKPETRARRIAKLIGKLAE